MSPAFAGSSQLTVQKQEVSPAVADKLAALSVDEPLPSLPPADRIRLLVQAPRRLFVYWSLVRNPYPALERAFRQRAADYSLVLRLIDRTTGRQTLHTASPSQSQWLEAEPGHLYRVELGMHAEGRPFIRLIASGSVAAPRAGVARHTSSESQWRVSPSAFSRALERAGYGGEAFQVALEAVDEESHRSVTRELAESLADASLPMMDEESLVELRNIIAALVAGTTISSVPMPITEAARLWLARLAERPGGHLDRAALISYLRSFLGLEAEEAGQQAQGHLRAAMLPVASGSGQYMPSAPFRFWMPSMTAGGRATRDRQVSP